MTVSLVAAATGSFSGTASTVCFIVGCFLLALAILFFFLFDIPGVFLLRTGKGVRKTIKKMKEINAQTGRLRNIKNDYMISQSGEITGETSNPTEPLQQQSQPAEGGSATTVLSPTETTLLQQSNETTVLSSTVTAETGTVEYKRETSGRFDIVYNLMLIHSDEII